MPRPIKPKAPAPPSVSLPASDCKLAAEETVAEWEAAGRRDWDKHAARFYALYPNAGAVLRRARLMVY